MGRRGYKKLGYPPCKARGALTTPPPRGGGVGVKLIDYIIEST